MEISVDQVHSFFRQLLQGTASREEASRWAADVMRKEENDELTYSPREKESAIWSGVMSLAHVDLRAAPDCYLYSDEDIREMLGAFTGAVSSS